MKGVRRRQGAFVIRLTGMQYNAYSSYHINTKLYYDKHQNGPDQAQIALAIACGWPGKQGQTRPETKRRFSSDPISGSSIDASCISAAQYGQQGRKFRFQSRFS